jgi:FkbM family methyltransferase
VRIHLPQPNFIMKNPITQSNTKNGKFIHFVNDDPIGSCLTYYGEWAQQELDFFDGILTETSNVIDVGANIGTHSVYFARKCNKGSVIAIEPQIYIFEMLAANILINGCYNVYPVHAGAASKPGNIKMVNISPFEGKSVNYGEFKINSGTEKGFGTNLIALDSFIDLDPFNLIKLDVEGYEVEVLSGATNLLEKHKPYLYIEFNNKEGNNSLLEKIYELNYIPYWHIYTKYNPYNTNGQTKNIWEPNIGYCPFILDESNLDIRYEGNAFCVHKDEEQPEQLRVIEMGDSITRQIFQVGL